MLYDRMNTYGLVRKSHDVFTVVNTGMSHPRFQMTMRRSVRDQYDKMK